MSKNILALFVVMLVIFAGPVQTKAQTIDMQDALSRMNSIIAEMEKLRSEFAALTASVGTQTVKPAVLGVSTGPIFTQPLEFGETNDDIKRIQKLLATDGEIYPYGVASGFFGPKTEEAIMNLQARNGWDTPGVVGPSTRALLEAYFKAYPDENWPATVLKSKPPAPQVQGASVSSDTSTVTTPTYTPASTVSGSNLAKEINVTFDAPEALIEIVYSNGNRKGLVADTTDKDEIILYIVGRTVLTEAMVREVIDYSGRASSDSKSSGSDESDAEDALDDADKAIDDADDEIEAADEDGDDVDWAEDTLRDAKRKLDDAEEAFDVEDYDEAVELAKEAEELAKEAEDRIDEEKGSSSDADEIDKIRVTVGDGESRVRVDYEDGDDRKFDVDEDDEDDIIEAIARKLDLDEDDVEDLVRFDYGDIDRIEVRIGDDDSLVRIFYESGFEARFRPDETDEDDIIEYLADELDMDEDEIEDIIDFD